MLHITNRPKCRIHERGNWMKLRDPQKLRTWRRHRDLTQRQLAYLCNCSQNAIHLLETGQMITISEDLAMLICRRLDIPWEDMFTAEGTSGTRRAPSAKSGKTSKRTAA